MNDQNINTPNQTVPNQNIFDAAKVQVQPQASGMSGNDKEKIIANHRRFPKNILVLVFGGVILLLILIVVGKILFTKVASSSTKTIIWWGVDEDESAVTSLINKYKESNPNVEIVFKHQDLQDYRERLANAIAQGKGPDIFEFHNSWVPMFKNTLAPSKEDFSNVFYPVVANDLKAANGFLGVPLEYNQITLFVNQDIFSSYGKNAPRTWDDLRSIAQQLTIRDANGKIQQAGAAMGVTNNIDYWQDILALLLLQNGADLRNPASAVGGNALTFYSNFSKVDHVWDETLPVSTADFANGQLAMYFGKYEDAFKIKRLNPNLHFSVVTLPQLPTNASTIPSISYASYFASGVSKSSRNQDAAWDFLKFVTQANSLRELYKNEVAIRGYGNLYPRVDMQNDLLSDQWAAPFIYQANFAQSWYLYDKTMDGETGINTLVGKAYADAIVNANGNADAATSLKNIQTELLQALATYGLATLPKATP